MVVTDKLINEFVHKTCVSKFTAKRQLEKSTSFDEALKFLTEHKCPKCGELLSCFPTMTPMLDAAKMDCTFCGSDYTYWGQTGEIS